jgi:hypothetical protein
MLEEKPARRQEHLVRVPGRTSVKEGVTSIEWCSIGWIIGREIREECVDNIARQCAIVDDEMTYKIHEGSILCGS